MVRTPLQAVCPKGLGGRTFRESCGSVYGLQGTYSDGWRQHGTGWLRVSLISLTSSLFDLPAEWYLKTRRSVQQFTICQIGECSPDSPVPKYCV